MKARKKSDNQGQLLGGDLLEHLNPQNPLMLLNRKIPWEFLEKELAPLYGEGGRPAKPIRLMCGLLILKQLENLSDEHLIEQWVQNPYFQAFCGEHTFQWRAPCASSDLSHFRKRIGEAGVEKIFQVSVTLHGARALEKEVLIDTTVQEKNITFPTDSKLLAKIVSWCWKIGKEFEIQWRRSYKREMKIVIRTINFSRGIKNAKQVGKARRRLRTIAGVLFRELKRKLSTTALKTFADKLEIFGKVLSQRKNDKNKIYSLHEPGTLCIAKGKSHKKYEFGSKVCFVTGKNKGVVLGAKNFEQNLYDGDTVEETVRQMERILNYKPELGIADKGFRGRKKILGVNILTPANQGHKLSESDKRGNRKRNKRRSAIEPVIGHLKSDFRMARNFLRGTLGDAINALMAAAAFNFKKWMRKARLGFLFSFLRCLVASVINAQNIRGRNISFQ
jgi:Transposase DDE domain./Transposase domain (DUF772).